MDDRYNRRISEEKQMLLKKLYESYEQSLYRIAYSILNNIEQAEDATHDAFVKVVPYLSRISDCNSIETKRLLIRIVKNVSIDKYRRNHKENKIFTGIQNEDLHSDDAMGATSVQTVEDRSVVSQIMNQLDQSDREIIQLRCFYELPYKEIAVILEVSDDVAMKRFQRARRKVQKLNGGMKDEG